MQGIESRRVNTKEAARYCGLGSNTLVKKRITGGGPRFLKLGPRRVVYDTRDLDAWLDANRRSSTSC